jgi:hypothetical protein
MGQPQLEVFDERQTGAEGTTQVPESAETVCLDSSVANGETILSLIICHRIYLGSRL